MIRFTTTIKKFDEQGEKTGWTYIEISSELAEKLMPGNKKSFRVKGFLDAQPFERISLLPMGGGHFIMALKAALRKKIRKAQGASLSVQMEVDEKPLQPSPAFWECLQDEPAALHFFMALPKSRQHYFINWVDGVKTENAKAKRIAHAVSSLAKKTGFCANDSQLSGKPLSINYSFAG